MNQITLGASRILPLALTLLTGFAAPASGAEITLKLIDSYARSGPFGLAFDGTHIYWSNSGGQVQQVTTAGVDTGVTWNTGIWSELAWDASRSQLAQARFQTLTYFDVGGGNVSTQTLNDPMSGITSLQDGLDIDSGEIWISPDVGNVYRYNQATGNFAGANPFLGGAGGYSGVERVTVGSTGYVIVVNDASSPRRLCVHDLAGSELGCDTFSNQRYEGLAFDGRYLWAADFYGNKIDKYDVLSDGGSILNPVPEPSTVGMMFSSVVMLGFVYRNRIKSHRQ